MTIGFEGRVAIVTGAGGGLGRAYALALAARGAKVVVNDLGGARDGTGSGSAADQVVAEIAAAGGEGLANHASVTDLAQVEAMVEEARATWGRVDILINNAGILRDKSFAKMEMEDFRAVVDVHLIGSANCTKAVWEPMREQGYGRILMTASSTGLYGNFGQANYGAAKLALAGFAKSLNLEGVKHNVRVSTIVPIAGTRMTEDVLPPEVFKQFAPENVVPAALYLVSEDAPGNVIIGAAAGVFHAVNVTMTEGVVLPPEERTPEGVAAHWAKIIDRANESVPQSGPEHIMSVVRRLQAAGK